MLPMGVFKVCGCGRSYSRETWSDLVLAGEQVDEVERSELRHCPCGSTIAVRIAVRATVTYAIEESPKGFVVVRQAGTREPERHVGWARHYSTRRHAEEAIRHARRSDTGAATRLGVEIVDDETSGT